MIKTKDAVITVKSVYDGDKTDRQAFIELILQRQNENNILKRKKTIDGDRNREYIIDMFDNPPELSMKMPIPSPFSYVEVGLSNMSITPDAVYTA